ncbi:uroporphyrin-III C-methyltransferase [compost metagenome]
MGVRTRAELAASLLGRGWPAATPAALVANASHPDQAAWTGTLDGLAAAPIDPEAAAVIVIGAVVTLAAALSPQVATLRALGGAS